MFQHVLDIKLAKCHEKLIMLSRLDTLLISSDILVYTDSIMRTVHKKYAVFYCASFGTTLIATMLSISKISRKVNNVISRDLFF